ncbi:unnamed protein product [Caenorhabditis auriculariae]|uniref:Uncharacterized protein n=1 Tax=Caenorhabditis auriculariae TaxID=2777116 RepID=A0A8S1HIQ7_9PELO|nr:unnamed protein product [Caenorhabditis auriculariae]
MTYQSKSYRKPKNKPTKDGTSKRDCRRENDKSCAGRRAKVHFVFQKGVILPHQPDAVKTSAQKIVYEKFVKKITTMGVQALVDEYQEKVKVYIPQRFSREVFDANHPKNRYKDVVCNDYTRVVLTDGHESGDYIHANYVHGLHSTFILAQGPKENTMLDFWRMVIQEKVAIICMLCETIENNHPKCFQYWPLKLEESANFGGITVTTTAVDTTDANITKTVLRVETATTRLVVWHLHCRSWPDKSVPQSSMSVLRLLFYTRATEMPVVVHCSAGIGRTGTLVAIEAGLQTLNAGKPLDLVETCRLIRNCRTSAVQVDLQYLAMAECIAEYGRVIGYYTDSNLIRAVEEFKENTAKYVAKAMANGAVVQPCIAPPAQAPAPKFEEKSDDDEDEGSTVKKKPAPKTWKVEELLAVQKDMSVAVGVSPLDENPAPNRNTRQRSRPSRNADSSKLRNKVSTMLAPKNPNRSLKVKKKGGKTARTVQRKPLTATVSSHEMQPVEALKPRSSGDLKEQRSRDSTKVHKKQVATSRDARPTPPVIELPARNASLEGGQESRKVPKKKHSGEMLQKTTFVKLQDEHAAARSLMTKPAVTPPTPDEKPEHSSEQLSKPRVCPPSVYYRMPRE